MRRIVSFKREIYVLSCAAVGGKEESFGPLCGKFDITSRDDRFGMNTWEEAEAEMGRLSLGVALKRAGFYPDKPDVLLAGDLENQCVASATGLYTYGIPYLGLYSACSTCTEGILLGAALISEGGHDSCAVVTGSHNAAAERQFRTPVEYGGQRTPTAQWTATAAGAFCLGGGDHFGEHTGVRIFGGMVGKVVDGLTTDGSNMGAAMARAAFDSISTFFTLSGRRVEDYDKIVTGDLGRVGSEVLRELLSSEIPEAALRHVDCGTLLYGEEKPSLMAGASGCGCSAALLAAEFIPKLRDGELSRILFLSTGALMNPQSVLQGKSILGVAPVIDIGGVKCS